MRFAQIVFSPTGGTQKVADAVTEVWGTHVDRVDLTDAGEDFFKNDVPERGYCTGGSAFLWRACPGTCRKTAWADTW